MKKKILLVSMAMIMMLIPASLFAAVKNVKPFVIPEIREWIGSTGMFEITENSKES